MCWARKNSNNWYRIAPSQEGTQRDMAMTIASTNCAHRTKKGLFNSKEVRKKIKNSSSPPVCFECNKVEEKPKDDELWVCVTCGQAACSEHSAKHTTANRTGDPHSIFYKKEANLLRCNSCEADLQPSEDFSNDKVKEFLNDMKSFVINSTNKKPKQEKEKPVKNAQNASEENGEDVKEAKGNGIKGGKANDRVAVKKQNALSNGGNSLLPARGLPNLGNTCFYNSVMQCVMHTHQLVHYLQWFGRVRSVHVPTRTLLVNEEKIQLEEVNLQISPEDCPLNDALRSFIAEFQHGSAPSPSPLFSQISRKSPRFKGWQQQDAHELLRCLMDGLRSEEMEMCKTAIAKHLHVPNKNSIKNVDPVIVKQAKGYLQACGRPLLDAIFGGTLMQTIRCSECGHISERQEQFLDLSLPISSNPMRANAGGQQLSAHQIKKAKKTRRQQTKQQVAKGNASSNLIGEVGRMSLEDREESSEDRDADTEGEGQSAEESEQEQDNMKIATDPADFTKVLVPAPAEYSNGRSVGNCLLEFTAEELLAGANAYECEKCCAPVNKKSGATGNKKKRVAALKRYLILEPPTVLTLHLKRFQQVAGGFYGRSTTRKIGGHVHFSLQFNIAPFCSRNVERITPGSRSILYSLYGVVSHSGDLGGGHYVAYVKSRHRVQQALQFIEAARASCVDGLSFPPTLPTLTLEQNPADAQSPDGQWYYCSDSHVSLVSENKVLNVEAYILFYERIL